jgi:hypothetical protein
MGSDLLKDCCFEIESREMKFGSIAVSDRIFLSTRKA